MKDKMYDVIIVGGSYSGLSAALALGRSMRTVLVIDDQRSCNIQTPHSHNFITNDGKTPEKFQHSQNAKSKITLRCNSSTDGQRQEAKRRTVLKSGPTQMKPSVQRSYYLQQA
ncbi:MAG: FAD-dependent oxidoreductase [Bacteroidota bacterium]